MASVRTVWLLIFITFFGSKTVNTLTIRNHQSPSKGNTRINGGNIAEPNEFPWLAFIETFAPTSDTTLTNNESPVTGFQASKSLYYECAATLISDRCLLTVSSCVPENVVVSTTVALGLHNYSNWENEPNVRLYETNQYYYLHEPLPRFDVDLALIVLPVKLNLTEFIRPIHLPKLDGTESDHDGDNVTLAGWGDYYSSTVLPRLSDVVRKVNTTVMNNTDCRETFLAISSNVICASGDNGAGACTGDAGTPMMYYDENLSQQWSLLGVSAFASGEGCNKNRPSGYYRLQSESVMSWIDGYCISNTPPFACPIDSSDIAYPDPEDCTAYYLCFEGQEPLRYVCPSETAFNPWTRMCDYGYPECLGVSRSHHQQQSESNDDQLRTEGSSDSNNNMDVISCPSQLELPWLGSSVSFNCWQLPQLETNSSCYCFSRNEIFSQNQGFSRDEALLICKKLNMTIVSIETPDENHFLKQFLVQMKTDTVTRLHTRFWTSGQYFESIGNYSWWNDAESSYEPFTFFDWIPGMPHITEPISESCVVFIVPVTVDQPAWVDEFYTTIITLGGYLGVMCESQN